MKGGRSSEGREKDKENQGGRRQKRKDRQHARQNLLLKTSPANTAVHLISVSYIGDQQHGQELTFCSSFSMDADKLTKLLLSKVLPFDAWRRSSACFRTWDLIKLRVPSERRK